MQVYNFPGVYLAYPTTTQFASRQVYFSFHDTSTYKSLCIYISCTTMRKLIFFSENDSVMLTWLFPVASICKQLYLCMCMCVLFFANILFLKEKQEFLTKWRSCYLPHFQHLSYFKLQSVFTSLLPAIWKLPQSSPVLS